jgi:hypothetical protein
MKQLKETGRNPAGLGHFFDSRLALDARMFTIDMNGISFGIWIGLGGQNSGPFPFSEQKQKALRHCPEGLPSTSRMLRLGLLSSCAGHFAVHDEPERRALRARARESALIATLHSVVDPKVRHSLARLEARLWADKIERLSANPSRRCAGQSPRESRFARLCPS